MLPVFVTQFSPCSAPRRTLHLALIFACQMMKEFSEQLTVVRGYDPKAFMNITAGHKTVKSCFKMHTDLMNRVR